MVWILSQRGWAWHHMLTRNASKNVLKQQRRLHPCFPKKKQRDSNPRISRFEHRQEAPNNGGFKAMLSGFRSSFKPSEAKVISYTSLLRALRRRWVQSLHWSLSCQIVAMLSRWISAYFIIQRWGYLPSGKVTKHNYGKSQFSMGKSTIMNHFQ